MCLRLFALLLGCSLLVGCSKTHLYGELPEREANEMMAILMANGISCEKTAGEEGTWSLAVSTSDFADSVEILSGLGRPRSKYESIPEIFPKSSFVSSPTEEHIRYTYSQSQALSKAVSDIPGIISAEVFVVLPQKQTYGESPQKSKAMARITYRRDDPTVQDKMMDIKTMIMTAVEGLTDENLTVKMFEADESIYGLGDIEIDEPEFVEIMSIRVAKESVTRLYALLISAGGLALIGVLIGLIGFRGKSGDSDEG